MKKTKLEQYAEMVKSRLKSINNIRKLLIEDDSLELRNQLVLETYSLNELLTGTYYSKLLKAERKLLLTEYVKNTKNCEKSKKVS